MARAASLGTRISRSRLVAFVCVSALLAPTVVPGVSGGIAIAQGAPVLSALETGSYARLMVRLPSADAPAVTASGNDTVAVLRFPAPVDLDPSVFAEQAPGFVAAAAMSADKRSIRVALLRPARLQQSRNGALMAFDLVAPGQTAPPSVTADADRQPRPTNTADAAPGAAPAAGGAAAVVPAADAPLRNAPLPPDAARVPIEVASGREFSRILIRTPGPYQVTRAGDRVSVRLPGSKGLDLAQIRPSPPRNVREAARRYEGGATFLDLALLPGAGIRHFREGGDIVVDVTPPGVDVASVPPSPTPSATAQAPAKGAPPTAPTAPPPADKTGTAAAPTDGSAPATANPIPAGGVVVVEAKASKVKLELGFPFAAPVPAAMFKRGDSIWVLFEAPARLDLAAIPTKGKFVKAVTPVTANGVSGVRLTVPANVNAVPVALGGRWRVDLQEAGASPARVITARRESSADGTQRLDLDATDAAGARWLDDPSVGDRIGVGFVYGPTAAVTAQRSFVEAVVPPTYHGVLVTPRADGVDLRPAPGRFVVGKASGLAASFTGEPTVQASKSPAFISFQTWRVGPAADFNKNRARLERAAAMEMGEANSPGQARLELARFLLAWELPHEASGVLRTILADNPTLSSSAEVAGLQGVALAMMDRHRTALDTLSSAALLADPAAALWRGLANAELEDWGQALNEFNAGAMALADFAPEQRSRFHEAAARAALAQGDLAMARREGMAARADARSDETKLRAAMVLSQMAAAGGATDKAIKALRLIEKAGNPEMAVRAKLLATTLESEAGKMSTEESVAALEDLRFAWRGDALEIEVLRRLGNIHLSGGRLREGLEVMKGALMLRSDIPEARRLRDDMSAVFRRLFLEGEANQLDPFQALAIFYDFSELTPIGPDGDRLIRNLADRLVSLDLLPQATELLQHQVDKRLEGFAKAQVATDLAALYMLDGKVKEALATIQTSRVAQLPDRLNAPRRLIEAAALAQLGRPDHALEVIAFDKTPQARALRTEIHWGAKEWPEAAAAVTASLPAAGQPLSPEQAADVMRGVVAYTLANDRGGVRGLEARHGRAMADTAFAGSFRAMTGTDSPTAGQIDTVVRELGATGGLDRMLRSLRADIGAASPSDPALVAGAETDAGALAPRRAPAAAAVAANVTAPRRPAPRPPGAATTTAAATNRTTPPPPRSGTASPKVNPDAVARSRIITGVPTTPGPEVSNRTASPNTVASR